MICWINSSSWLRACSSLPSAASPNSFSRRSSGSTPPLKSASRIASCSACMVRSLSSSVLRGFPNPLDISRSESFDMSSSMSSSSSRLGTYFEYLYFMFRLQAGLKTRLYVLVVVLLLPPRIARFFFVVVRSQDRRSRLLLLRTAHGFGAVVAARVAAADLLLRIQAFEQEIDRRCERRLRGVAID